MVDRVEKNYNYGVDKNLHTITYTVQSGENLSCFLKKYAEEQKYQHSDNKKITGEEWTNAFNILKERLEMTNINVIRIGQKITFSENDMADIMSAMGMSKQITTSSGTQKKYESWNEVQQKYTEINSLESDEEKVVAWHKENASQNKNNYVVIDKKNCLAKVYSADGKILESFEVGLGREKGDDYLQKDRPMTSAGIYTIDYRGNGRDGYAAKYNKNIFTLKTDKGATGVALHQIPNGNFGRYLKHNDGDSENNRYSNGCINFTKNDFKILEKYIGIETKVYVLPEDNNNYLIVKNGQLNLTQKKFTGQVMTSLTGTDSKKIKINFKAKKYKSAQVQEFTNTLQNKKAELMKKLNIDNDTYNDLAALALGIMGQESDYGKSIKYMLKENFSAIIPLIKSVLGRKSCSSRGLTQMKINSYTDPKTIKLLAEYGINENNLSNPKNSAIATMIALACMYKNELPGLSTKLTELNMNKMDAMLYLWNGKKREITNDTATPDKNIYVNHVKKFAYNNFNIRQAEYSLM